MAHARAVTVLEAIQRTMSFLTKKGVDASRLQAELLLAHVLKLPRMQLYLKFERALSPAEEDELRQLAVRRGQREPLQHILGTTCFCGLELIVTPQTLIPRPETELLAEQGWTFLNARVQAAGPADSASENGPVPEGRGPMALDFGTGSGCLAIALAFNCPSARLVALDIAPKALEVARNNAARHSLAERIDFVLSDGLSAVSRDLSFDLIIGNPPYIPSSEIETLEPEVRIHDPRIALDGGPDGLNFYRQLAAHAGALLRPRGKLMLEFGDGQEKQLSELFQRENWIVERVLQDYTQRPRLLIAQKKIRPRQE